MKTMKTMKPVTGCRSNCKSYYTEGEPFCQREADKKFIQTSEWINFLHKISTHLLIMEVDFCPVLCIPKVPVLQAFRALAILSGIVKQCQICRKCRKFVVKK